MNTKQSKTGTKAKNSKVSKLAAAELDEVEWVKTQVIPLLQQMGLLHVTLTHGTTEAGKDVVFAEVDRFGQLRWYAIQAKLELKANGLEATSKIAEQLSDAWSVPYRDAKTGAEHYMSGVILLVRGTITTGMADAVRGRVGRDQKNWLQIFDSSQLETARQLSAWPSPRERQVVLEALATEMETQTLAAVSSLCATALQIRLADEARRKATTHAQRAAVALRRISCATFRFATHTFDRAQPFLLAESPGNNNGTPYAALSIFFHAARNANVALDALGALFNPNRSEARILVHSARMMSTSFLPAVEWLRALQGKSIHTMTAEIANDLNLWVDPTMDLAVSEVPGPPDPDADKGGDQSVPAKE